MAIMDGCESKHKTPVLEERRCPQCGEMVEVFTRKGRIVEESTCDCGYVFEVEEQLTPGPHRKPEEA